MKSAFKRNYTLLLICMALCTQLRATDTSNNIISKTTFNYAIKDTAHLGLDIYRKKSTDTAKQPCVIFVFGGAFITGRRDDTIYQKYFNALAEHNYTVVSVSYRLGLIGVKKLGIFNTAPLKNAIDMAVDDVYDATNWLIANAGSLHIDTAKIIISGSSAGAVTALECDFQRRNNKTIAAKLPPDFEYAGVISFSGAILSYDGKLKYQVAPAPTLLFHGTADKVMPYKKIRFFKKGFYGSSFIAEVFKNNGYPLYIYRAEGMGHEIAVLPMITQLPLIIQFLDDYVVNKKTYQTDISFKDPNEKPMMTLTIKELLNILQHH